MYVPSKRLHSLHSLLKLYIAYLFLLKNHYDYVLYMLSIDNSQVITFWTGPCFRNVQLGLADGIISSDGAIIADKFW